MLDDTVKHFPQNAWQEQLPDNTRKQHLSQPYLIIQRF
jgi:hypothetical protein